MTLLLAARLVAVRIGLLSDLHGNTVALDAVLADAEQQQIDRWLVLGDLVALGPDPVGMLERLTALPNTKFIRGNTDRYVVKGDVPPPYPDEVHEKPDLLGRVIEIARNFTWTQGCLAATGWLDWLADLPLEHRETLDDGTRLLAVHASPGTDDGHGIQPSLTDQELHALTADSEADLICVGHTHFAFARTTTHGTTVVNPGSISNPRPGDLRSSYAILDGTAVEHRRVEYDREAVIDAIRKARHPAAEFLVQLQRGWHPPD